MTTRSRVTQKVKIWTQKSTDINSGLKQIHEKLSGVMLSNSEILKNLIPEIKKNVREEVTEIFEDKLKVTNIRSRDKE